MKNIKITALVLLLGISFSCGEDFLNPSPTSAINAEDFYTTEAQVEAALLNMYDGIQGENNYTTGRNHAIQLEYQIAEMRSDNTRTKASEGEPAQMENFTVETNNGTVIDYYRSYYNVIFRANVVLENLSVVSEDNLAAFEGEAKFVRAYAYFNLVRLYGDIPLIDRVIGLDETDVQYTRVATSEIYNLIVSDLQAAVGSLDNSHINRASLAAAQTLLAKVYLTLGTNYVEAQTLLESVMSSGYALEPNFKDVFFNEGNGEVIFAIGYIPDNSADSQNFSAEWLNAVGRSSGLNYVTDECRQAFTDFGGDIRTDYSYRQDPEQPSQYQVIKYLPIGDEDLGIDPTGSNPTLAGNDWIVLRYSDVLLLHVEAIMAGGNSTSVQAALDSFQLVRDRAGLTDTVTSISKQELLDERRVELAFENHRLFDLIRFNEAQSVLSAFSDANGHGFTSTDLLLPIPQSEINLSNGALTQNPGY